MNYPPMLKNEKAYDYAIRNNLMQKAVIEALLNNEIPIEGEPLPAQPAQPAKPVITVAASTPAAPVTTEKPDSAQAEGAFSPKQRQEKWQQLHQDWDRLHEQWRQLHREGNSINQIAAKTGAKYVQVYKFLVDNGLHQPGTRSAPRTNGIDKLALENLDDEEAKLHAQLAAVQRKKQLLAEAKMLHVEPTDGGAVIKKEGNVVVLTHDEINQLVTKLTDLLTAPEVEQQV
jgi:hypothetical protein